MDPEISKIAENIVKKALTHQEIKMESLWEEKRCVIIFFRRFGCVFCRQSAKEISAISPLLFQNNVDLIGVGFDEFGVGEFVDGKFFAGEIYLDPLQKNYKALGHKRYGVVGMLSSLFNKKLQAKYQTTKTEGIAGNYQGDTYQQGGAIVVTAKKDGPHVLLSFKQDNPVDYVSNDEVLKVLEIANV